MDQANVSWDDATCIRAVTRTDCVRKSRKRLWWLVLLVPVLLVGGFRAVSWYQQRPISTLDMPKGYESIRTVHTGNFLGFMGDHAETTRYWTSSLGLDETCADLAGWL